jgi:hypothetical protein
MKARYNPFECNMIATRSESGKLFIFDYNLHGKETKNDKTRP